MAIVIAISVFGTIGIYTMSAPRVYFAMAKDGVFFKSLAKLHPKYQTPANAMIVQAVWAIFLLILWGKFEDLISYVTFMDIMFMTMAGAAIFIFRKNRKEVERPVRALGYPVVPIIFILISTAFVISTFFGKPQQAWGGLFILAIGWPVYYYFNSLENK